MIIFVIPSRVLAWRLASIMGGCRYIWKGKKRVMIIRGCGAGGFEESDVVSARPPASLQMEWHEPRVAASVRLHSVIADDD